MAAGEPDARTRLIQLVYDELHRIAAHRIAAERQNHTLQATALVNEAYLKMFGDTPLEWQNRAHFMASAAEAMRQILIDHARGKRRLKRGAGAVRVPLEDDVVGGLSLDSSAIDVIALDDALVRLEAFDARKSQIVKHRYFLGLTVDETAELLGLTPRTVDYDWRLAKAWLKREIEVGSPKIANE